MPRWVRAGLTGLALCGMATAAWAAEQAGKPSELIFFVDVALLILFGRLMGELAQRIGQPAVMGQLIAGLLLGPSVLGLLAPDLFKTLFAGGAAQKAMLDAVSQLGILMLLLLTGMETDLKLVRRVGRAATSVSVAGIAVPFACGFTLGQYLPEAMLPHPEHRLVASLFLGTALSISSVKIVAMVVREMNFMRRNLGQVIVASAVIDDTIGWVIIAITFSLATHGTVDAASLAQTLLGTAVFLIVSFTLGRRLVFALIRWSNDHLESEMPVISVILVLTVAMAVITHVIGVHSVLGAFVAGILIGESPILTRHIDQQLRGLIIGLFMPVFFGLAGLSADLSILADPRLLALTAGLVGIASLGKFAGAFLGGLGGRLSLSESLALACGMNARGSTEVIVATIGLSLGMLSRDLFTMIVAMAVITTMAMPPMLRWALARLPLGEEERKRLEREEFEAKGFLANLERFLLAADDSPNGQFAARLVGALAGRRGVPVTVLKLGRDDTADKAEAAVKAGAVAPAAGAAEPVSPVEVTVRRREADAKQAVADEARRGYDLLTIGLGEPLGQTGAFHPRVSRAAAGFDGPLAMLVARGPHLQRPLNSRCSILLPITGTEVSRRAAEIAVALARATGAPISALHVESDAVEAAVPERKRSTKRLQQERILKEAVALAERYDTDLRTAIRTDASPEQAILLEAEFGGHDLIVLGVNRRPGEVLFFGNVVQAAVTRSQASVLLVAG